MALAVFLFLGLYRKTCLGSQRGRFRLNPIKPAANRSSGSLSSGQHLWTGREAAAAAKSLQSCPTRCDPIDGSPPGSSVHKILQARILEWVAISFSNARMYAKSLQSCPTLCDPMDCSPPGSSIHGILQAGVLEWGANAPLLSNHPQCPTVI